jgi:hypothetical protein
MSITADFAVKVYAQPAMLYLYHSIVYLHLPFPVLLTHRVDTFTQILTAINA